MIGNFFTWLLTLLGFYKKQSVDTSKVDQAIKELEEDLNKIEKEKENVKENDSLDNNIDYFNNN